jgi:hypothetical protein
MAMSAMRRSAPARSSPSRRDPRHLHWPSRAQQQAPQQPRGRQERQQRPAQVPQLVLARTSGQ